MTAGIPHPRPPLQYVAFAEEHVVVATRDQYYLVLPKPAPPGVPPRFTAIRLLSIPSTPTTPVQEARAMALHVADTCQALIMGPDNLTMLLDRFGTAAPGGSV